MRPTILLTLFALTSFGDGIGPAAAQTWPELELALGQPVAFPVESNPKVRVVVPEGLLNVACPPVIFQPQLWLSCNGVVGTSRMLLPHRLAPQSATFPTDPAESVPTVETTMPWLLVYVRCRVNRQLVVTRPS